MGSRGYLCVVRVSCPCRLFGPCTCCSCGARMGAQRGCVLVQSAWLPRFGRAGNKLSPVGVVGLVGSARACAGAAPSLPCMLLASPVLCCNGARGLAACVAAAPASRLSLLCVAICSRRRGCVACVACFLSCCCGVAAAGPVCHVYVCPSPACFVRPRSVHCCTLCNLAQSCTRCFMPCCTMCVRLVMLCAYTACSIRLLSIHTDHMRRVIALTASCGQARA